ncbi:MAG: Flp pilus assembly protein CpaB [Patescibacteria group bacterium]|nr:Flp pilus assembly protein CpaB [Patescibacteria group bacterium]
MRGKSLALLVLALGCGLVASIGVTQVIAKRQVAAPSPTVETESIFVTLEDVSMGDLITAQVLKLEPWPKNKVPEGAFTKIGDIEGRRARTKLFTGEPIIERKLLRKGESSGGISPLIPKGMRVVSVKVDRVSGGGGLILPGNRVDVVVFLTQATTRGIPETTTRTVLQDIRVFAVNDEFDLDSQDADKRSITNAQTVSLLVTPTQAQKVMLAGEMGKIQLVLRSPEDDEQVDLASATARDIMQASDSGDRDRETLMEPEPESAAQDDKMKGFLEFLNQNAQAKADGGTGGPQAVPQSPENTTWNMRIVRAGRVEDIQLHEESGATGQRPTWRHGEAPMPEAAEPNGWQQAPLPLLEPDAPVPLEHPETESTSADAEDPGGRRE